MSLSGSHLCCSLVSVVELSCRVAILARRPRLLRFPSKAFPPTAPHKRETSRLGGGIRSQATAKVVEFVHELMQ